MNISYINQSLVRFFSVEKSTSVKRTFIDTEESYQIPEKFIISFSYFFSIFFSNENTQGHDS